MENDDIFEGDGAIRTRNEARGGDHSAGAKATAATTGTIPAAAESDEDIPLLARPRTISSERGDDGGGKPPGDEEDEASPFAHLPRWKRPSIFWILPTFVITALAFGGAMVPKVNIVLSLFCERYFADAIKTREGGLYGGMMPGGNASSGSDGGMGRHMGGGHMMPIIIGGDNAQCQIPEVQELVSSFQLLSSALAGILSALVAPVLGSYSDRHGRTGVIAFTVIGAIMGDLITIMVARNSHILSVYWLLLASMLEGASGSFIASMALVYAYAADCTPPRRREVIFGYIQGCMFTGMAIGPFIAAYLVKATGSLLSIMYVLVGAHTFYGVWNAFVVPDSLSKGKKAEARKQYEVARQKAGAQPGDEGWQGFFSALGRRLFHGDFFSALRCVWPTGPGTSSLLRRNLVILVAMDTANFAVAMGVFTVLVIYSEYMFKWETFQTQIFTGTVNIVRVLMLLIGLPLVARLRPKYERVLASDSEDGAADAKPSQKHHGSDTVDLAVIRASTVIDLLGYVGYASSQTGGAFLVSGVLVSLGGMASPTISSALTKHLPADRVGRLLGATALLHALARVGGPSLFNGVYYLSVKTFPRAVFVVLSVLFGGVVVVSWFVRPHVYFDEAEARESSRAQEGEHGNTNCDC